MKYMRKRLCAMLLLFGSKSTYFSSLEVNVYDKCYVNSISNTAGSIFCFNGMLHLLVKLCYRYLNLIIINIDWGHKVKGETTRIEKNAGCSLSTDIERCCIFSIACSLGTLWKIATLKYTWKKPIDILV